MSTSQIFKAHRVAVAILTLSSLGSASLRVPYGRSEGHWEFGSSASTVSTIEAKAASSCRQLPGDKAWPSDEAWNMLNTTIGGRLIAAKPLAKVCYSDDGQRINNTACAALQQEWSVVDPYFASPVNVMSPYWLNNTCSPFPGSNGTCTLGNLASYAINVTEVSDVQAGLAFVKEHNVRLTIKNTGHDMLGRSSGRGSLALWTHGLKNISFSNYTSPLYTGPAAKLGAGVQGLDVIEAASAYGLRVAAGSCPTVGVAGWLSGGGHGPLSGTYGLGADGALEFEVVTTEGKHMVASPTQNPDLYWALSGGGSGNYAIVISMTVKAHADSVVAGSAFMFLNTNDTAFWAAAEAWLRYLLVLDVEYPTLATDITFTSELFFLNYATLADQTAAQLNAALRPFLDEVASLGLDLILNETASHATFAEHYQYFTGVVPYAVNETLGNRLVPRETVRQNASELVNIIRGITDDYSDAVLVFLGMNVETQRLGVDATANSVNPAWRDSLLLINMGLELSPSADWNILRTQQAQVNSFQDRFRGLMPHGGGYLNEGTYDNPEWRTDYFGASYRRLASVKARYDPDYTLWTETAVAGPQCPASSSRGWP
ncbi:hypothetical protein F5Y16DRAFT_414289 [Xylariaceae sp. FL0255]|nr:hypothetical protein F5Y16DRAFT_414289 [Xylariaceae sp. FL0255]